MNALIAQLLLDRIEAADLPWLDKYAGLTRSTSILEGKKRITIPVSCNVTSTDCNPQEITDLIPDDKYRSVLFIEGDALPSRVNDRIPGVRYVAKLRIVVWMNCKRLGGGCDCGSLASMNLLSAIEKNHRNSYATDLFKGIRHKVTGGVSRGPDVFSRYTFNDDRSKYLHYPFDAFAIDTETEFGLMPGCEEKLQAENMPC